VKHFHSFVWGLDQWEAASSSNTSPTSNQWPAHAWLHKQKHLQPPLQQTFSLLIFTGHCWWIMIHMTHPPISRYKQSYWVNLWNKTHEKYSNMPGTHGANHCKRYCSKQKLETKRNEGWMDIHTVTRWRESIYITHSPAKCQYCPGQCSMGLFQFPSFQTRYEMKLDHGALDTKWN